MNRTTNITLLLAMAMAMPMASLAKDSKYVAKAEKLQAQKPSFDPALSDTYNVEWTTQSTESSQSMPVGGHDVGLNVWVQDNSLYFYISKSDAMDENNVFGKLGRVKIDLDPNPFAEGTSFSQKLVLKDGNCVVKATGKDGNEVAIKIWVDVFKPVIHVKVDSQKPIKTTAEYHSWRFEDTKIPMLGGFRESNDYGAYACHPVFSQPYTLYADVTKAQGNEVTFYHKNNNEDLTMNKAIDALEMRETIDLTAWHDPATDFTFGGIMTGENMSSKAEPSKGNYMHRDYLAYSLSSNKATKSQEILIALQTGQYKTPEDWKKDATATLKSVESEKDLEKSLAWWKKIWNRSHIMINAETPGAPGHDIARNYQLFRYMLACNAFGVHPSKFNGGMFTWDTVMDINGELFGSPDYRQWGPGLTLQNQRHMHWPMLRSGDYDMQAPAFNYFRDTFKNTEQLVKRAYGHKGAMYSEYFNFYGLPSMGNEYWTDPRKQPDGSDVELGAMGAPLVRFEHVHQLDFSFMMLEQQRYSGRDISQYIPFIESSLTFYLEHYKMRYKTYTREYEGSGKEDADGLDENGHLVIYPSTAVETYKNVLNPSDVIVALECVLEGMVRLQEEEPERYKNIQVAKWKKMLTMLPPLNLGNNINGDPIFKPGYDPGEMGEKSPFYKSGCHTSPYNIENPQLSIVFPFNKVSQGRPGAERAINTTETEFYAFNGGMKSHMSWSYYNLIVTRLGMVKDAEMYANLKLGNGGYRFPAFWGPGHDFSPDHNWGGTGIYGLQEMALQTYDDVITPFATWPTSWSGSFKLHAPEETIVEGFTMKDGSKAAIISLDDESKRTSIALQGLAPADVEIFSEDGAIKPSYDEKTKVLRFPAKADASYYLIDKSKDAAEPEKKEKVLSADQKMMLETKLSPKGTALYIKGLKDGKLIDSSGNNVPSLINGNVSTCPGVFGKGDTALQFGGGNYDYVVLPALGQDIKQSSFEFWVKTDKMNKGEAIFDARNSDMNSGFIGFCIDTFDTNYIRATGGDQKSFFDMLTDRTELSKGEWNHYKLNMDPKNGKIQAFLNGKGLFVRDIEKGGSIPVGPGRVTLGGGRIPGSFNFKGLLDEIKLKHYEGGIATPKAAKLMVKNGKFRVIVLLSDGSKVDMTPIAIVKDSEGNILETTQEGDIKLNGTGKTLQAEVSYDGIELKSKGVKAAK